MRCVNVKTPSKSYDCIIGSDLISQTGTFARESFGVRSAAIITDDIVGALYGNTVKSSLESAGFDVSYMEIPHGEHSKNPDTLIQILEFFASCKLTRTDIAVALGGGVIGDITGLASSMYLRGIRYIQMPTTVLSAVDSSVGGKCAVNLKAGKNLAGAFWQPSLVLCDYGTFDTLGDDIFADGCAEIIKYGVLGDASLFDSLKLHVSEQRENIIAKCVAMKRDIVSVDETDTGIRQILNLGHTAAHAFEKCSDFKIPHGKAVAAGIVTAAKASIRFGICEDKRCADLISDMLALYNLPSAFDEFTPAQLCEAALSDKKRDGSTITLVLPMKIGECVLHKVGVSELIKFFEG